MNLFTRIKNLFGSETPKTIVTAAPQFRAQMPLEPVVALFKPTQDFIGRTPDGQLLGSYKKDKIYYIRKGNTMLADLCKDWAREGKIIISGGKNANS